MRVEKRLILLQSQSLVSLPVYRSLSLDTLDLLSEAMNLSEIETSLTYLLFSFFNNPFHLLYSLVRPSQLLEQFPVILGFRVHLSI